MRVCAFIRRFIILITYLDFSDQSYKVTLSFIVIFFSKIKIQTHYILCKPIKKKRTLTVTVFLFT